MKVTMYAMRDKESGHFMKFREYCDDGWGKYHREWYTIGPSDMPTMFDEYRMQTAKIRSFDFEEEVVPKNIEWVKITLEYDTDK